MHKQKIIFFIVAMINCAALAVAEDHPPASINVPVPSAPSSDSIVSWSPSQELLKDLGDEEKFSTFLIRPPKGYSLTQLPGPPGAELFTWRGAVRADQSSPFLMVTIVTPPPEEQKQYTALEALDILMAGIEQRRDNWKQLPVEKGQINNFEFIRTYWMGTDKETGSEMKGFMYVTLDGKNIVQIASQDLASNDKAFVTAETAALTFRK